MIPTLSEDIRICLGHDGLEDGQDGAMAPPIVQTSLFCKASHQELGAALAAEHEHHVYTRGQNPTVEALERKIALLERGEVCKCFASGMAAVAACLFASVRQGDHILFVNNVYGPTLQLAKRLESFGVSHDYLRTTDLETVEAALRPETRLIYFESPGTMLFKVLDIAALCSLAKARNIRTVIDNTWATPLFQKPLLLGVDLVVHSATKYLSGHSDVVAGAVIGGRETMRRLFYDAYLLLGGALGPMDAWLVHRGLRTFPTRMQQHHKDGLGVAAFLRRHPKVRRVYHPWVEPADRAQSESQMSGASGLFSFELNTESFPRVALFVDHLKLFKIGVSWGGVESLVIAPFRGDNAADLTAAGLPLGLVRLSVGLEGAGALIEDLARALDAAL